jgi:hypothetical protein
VVDFVNSSEYANSRTSVHSGKYEVALFDAVVSKEVSKRLPKYYNIFLEVAEEIGKDLIPSVDVDSLNENISILERMYY